MKFIKETKNNIVYYTVPEFTKQGFNNVFTTKRSGASFEEKELNFGTNCNDTPEAILENYENALKLIDSTPEKTIKSKQTHSDIVLMVNKSYAGQGIIRDHSFFEADGLITNEKDLSLLIFFADCVPILIADKKTRVISAIHSGWRGTKDNIITVAIKKFTEKLGSDPNDLIFAIGPSIGVCHFEVNKELHFELTSLYGQDCGRIENQKHYLNLRQAIFNQITKCGVPKENIAVSDECTYCNKELYSFRREDDKAGRMAAAITINNEQ